MTAYITPSAKQQFFDSNGNPLSGGKVYTYAAGTTTPAATYVDSAGVTANTNPIILDSRGEANIWLSGSSSIKFKLTTSADVEIWTVDNVPSNASLASLSNSNGSSLVGFLQSGTNAVATTVQAKLREAVSVKDFGATGDGVADDTAEIQAALDAVGTAGGGMLYFPAGTYLTSSALLVSDDTQCIGSGIGGTIIKHPASHGFKNKLYASTGNSRITIRDMTFDADASYDGAVSMVGVTNLRCENLQIKNTTLTGVTVGIAVGSSASANSSDIFISNCTLDVADYGVVLDSTTAGECSNVVISNCSITTEWGSCVSLAGDVRQISVSDNVFFVPGDSVSSPQIGIGVKLWSGIDVSNAPMNVSISGNTFYGATTRTTLVGVSAANWAQSVVISNNTFEKLTTAFQNDYAGTGTVGVTFSNNIVRSCDNGVLASTSTDVEPTYVGNTFESCTIGISSTLRNGIVSSNKFKTITEQAIYAVSPTEHCTISANSFKDIGRQAIYFVTSSASNDGATITGNSIWDSCTAADNTYSSIELNTSAHVVVGNSIVNESTTIKPKYIIGSPAGANYRNISTNWFYGARSGYREVTGANDVYGSNLERGGIG